MKVPKTPIPVVVAFVLVAGFMAFQSSKLVGNPCFSPQANQLPAVKNPAKEETTAELAAEHAARRDQVKSYCRARWDHFHPNKTNKMVMDNFLEDEGRGLVYCFIPKNGCSFWKRVMSVLGGKHEGAAIFNLSSIAIHRTRGAFHIFGYDDDKGKPDSFLDRYHRLSASTKFLFVRDPYERLFSGYVDKFFTPCVMGGILRMIVNKFGLPELVSIRRETSPRAVTFTEFLRYVTNTQGVPVDGHFSQQHNKCWPCLVDYDFIGRMETFQQDAHFLLHSVGVDPEQLLGPEETFGERSDLNIMDDLAARTFSFCKNGQYKPPSKYHVLLRLWTTYQIRGFISLTVGLPLSRKEASDISPRDFKTLARDAYRRSEDRETVRGQRHLAFLEAYHSVPRSLLHTVEQYLADDCRLFGYDCSIDSRFNISTKPKPVFHFNKVLFPGKENKV